MLRDNVTKLSRSTFTAFPEYETLKTATMPEEACSLGQMLLFGSAETLSKQSSSKLSKKRSNVMDVFLVFDGMLQLIEVLLSLAGKVCDLGQKSHSYAAMSWMYQSVCLGVLMSHVLSFSFRLDQGVDNVRYCKTKMRPWT